MKTVHTPSKAQQAYARIRDLLDRGGISTDNPLTELGLTEMVGINRGPVRESLLRLEGEGRIRFRGRRRGRVIEFLEDQDKEQLLKRYEMREFIVAGAARLAARNMTGYQLEELRHIAVHSEEFKPSSRARKRFTLQFWEYLLSHCGNELLYDAWDRYNLKPPAPRSSKLEQRVMQNIAPRERNLNWLSEIADAIASHNGDLAEQAVRKGVQVITEALRKTEWKPT